MSKLLKAWSLACGRSFIVVMIATAVVLPLGCVFVIIPTPTVTAEESSAERLVRSGGAGRIGLVIVALLVGGPTCLLALAAVVFFVWAVR